MTAKVLRPVITLTTVMAILVTAVAAYAFMTAGTASADSTYDPDTKVKLCNAMVSDFGSTDPSLVGNPLCADVLTAGSHPDVTTTLTHVSGDLNFTNVVTLAPVSQTIAAGGSMPVGTKIGGLHSASTLGLLNGACNTLTPVDFILYNVALPNNTGTPRSSTNIAFPRPQGSEKRFDGWQIGSEPGATGGATPADTDSNSSADSSSLAIQNYPSYLLNIFDPDFVPGGAGGGVDTDGAADPLIPLAVYGGLTNVVGSWIPLFFAQFSAGGLTALPQPLGSLNAAMGQPSVSVLNDPSQVNASPSTINDFCTALEVTTMLLGAPSGNFRVTQPGALTTQLTLQYNASFRDTDQDGYENSLDTCPINVNAGNPRLAGVAGGDTDGDGIDNSCDTNLPVAISGDVDGDGFQNRQDNCPQVANGNPTQVPPPAAGNANNLEDEAPVAPADKGPRGDSIGNACDSEAGVISVSQNCQGTGAVCPNVTITMSDSVANGRYMTATNVVAKCIAGTDADADGYCGTSTANGDAFDNPGAAGCTPNCAARHTGWTNANYGLAAIQMDTDSDSAGGANGNIWSDAAETWLSKCDSTSTSPGVVACPAPTGANSFGADPTKPCAQVIFPATGNADREGPLDNWPFDLNDDGRVTGTDILRMGPAFGKTVNQGVVTVSGFVSPVPIHRFDLTLDGIVSGPDLLKFGPYFGLLCGSTGTLGIPSWSQQ